MRDSDDLFVHKVLDRHRLNNTNNMFERFHIMAAKVAPKKTTATTAKKEADKVAASVRKAAASTKVTPKPAAARKSAPAPKTPAKTSQAGSKAATPARKTAVKKAAPAKAASPASVVDGKVPTLKMVWASDNSPKPGQSFMEFEWTVRGYRDPLTFSHTFVVKTEDVERLAAAAYDGVLFTTPVVKVKRNKATVEATVNITTNLGNIGKALTRLGY